MNIPLAPDEPAAPGAQDANALPEPDNGVQLEYELRDPMQPWSLAAILLLCAAAAGFVARLWN